MMSAVIPLVSRYAAILMRPIGAMMFASLEMSPVAFWGLYPRA